MKCAYCGVEFPCAAQRVNRAAVIGAPLYCSRAHAGVARRLATTPTEDERKEAKRLYDAKRRVEKADEIRAKKADWHLRTYDPAKAAIERAKHMQRHIEYCRQPEYRVKKAEYDKAKRLQKYGPFAEAATLLDELETEIRSRATRYEIYIANGRFTRSAQQRRRELWQLIQRN